MSDEDNAHLSPGRGELVVGVWSDLPIEFDVLCQAADGALQGKMRGWFEPRLEVLPDGRFSYALTQWQLGQIGTMIISKRPGNKSSVKFSRTMAETEELDRGRRKHLADVIDVFFQKLIYERLLSTKNQERHYLAPEDIQRQKDIVKKAIACRAAGKLWKEVAKELNMSARTLRDWRCNPLYQ
jgi:hypothetical protein